MKRLEDFLFDERNLVFISETNSKATPTVLSSIHLQVAFYACVRANQANHLQYHKKYTREDHRNLRIQTHPAYQIPPQIITSKRHKN